MMTFMNNSTGGNIWFLDQAFGCLCNDFFCLQTRPVHEDYLIGSIVGASFGRCLFELSERFDLFFFSNEVDAIEVKIEEEELEAEN